MADANAIRDTKALEGNTPADQSAHLAALVSEQLATADARGGPDNSAVTERGIRGVFYDALELAARQQWAYRLGLSVASDTKTEKHRWLGSVPEPRKHFGGLNASPLRDYSLDVTNEDFEITLPLSLHDWRRDKTGHMARKVAELAVAWADHWNSLCVDVMENNDTAYNGTALFSSTHSIGDSGTIDNLLVAGDLASLNVATAASATKAEAAAILSGLAAKLYGFKDDYGRPANTAAKHFVCLTTPAQYPGFQQAVSDMLYVSGGSNELRNLGMTFEVVAEPRLTGGDAVIYFARADGMSQKPFILQEELSPTVQVVGPDSEHAIKSNEVLYVSKACRAAAPGEFRHIAKATLS